VRFDAPRADQAVGALLPGVEARVRTLDGIPTARGEVGELHVRGRNVMLGYYRAPELTAKAIDSEGWFNTGDLARFDGDCLYIVGRTKEMIIRSGFNVYPNEIEEVIASHPGVLECAVIGVPDERSGEAVKAFIVKKDPNVTAEDIIKFCHEQLTNYKIPKQIEFRTELPKTNVGKILRRQLRDEKKAAA